ncbi:MAG: hypothetical protein WCI65_07105 [Synechococcaceae cyanobacterium ELA263]
MPQGKSVSHIKAIAIATSLALSAITPLPAFSDQFGLKMGEAISSIISKGINLKPTGTSNLYKATSILPGNKMFDNYRFFIVKGVGLCQITGWIPVIEDSGYGEQTQARFSQLYEMLTSKYGLSKKFDFLRSGSIWNGSSEWVMSLMQKDRYLIAIWSEQQGSKLPPDIKGIMLNTVGAGPQSALISIQYEFRNIDKCVAVDKKEAAANL